jgi:hypothetical protein
VTDTSPALSHSYAAARAGFLAAASDAGATVLTTTIDARGPTGEELALDVAWLGPTDADDVVLVVSGTHGVEGFAGSMCQTHWLADGGAATRPETCAVVLLHAFNPYGFAWVRRVNEDNVDINRNFVDHADPPATPAYDQLADILAPAEWTTEVQASTGQALVEWATTHGMDAIQAAVSGGQYHHPDGLFYGGSAPTASRLALQAFARDHLSGRKRVVVLDLHTGLGEQGAVELICPLAPGTESYARAVRWWGSLVASNAGGDSVSAPLHGEWLTVLPIMVPGTEVSGIALEWGTVDTLAVIDALRADNWLHTRGDPAGPDAPAIKAALRAAFAPDDPIWAATVYRGFTAVVADTLAALAPPPGLV